MVGDGGKGRRRWESESALEWKLRIGSREV